MRNRLRVLLLISVILAFSATLAYWWGSPRILSYSPLGGASTVPAGREISLTFSRPMQEATVIERLSISPRHQGIFNWFENTLIFTPSEPWDPGISVQVELKPGGRAAGLLSLPTREGINWSFRIRQPELAYLYPANLPANVYVLDPLSGENHPLTDHPVGVDTFSVNSTGTAIYYSAKDGRGGSEIFRLDLLHDADSVIDQDTPEEPLLPTPVLVVSCPGTQCSSPEVSPNGKYLAYERTTLPGDDGTSIPQVWVQPLVDEQALPVQMPDPFIAGEPKNQTIQPLWSPEGRLSYYDRDLTAYVILDIESGQQILFPNMTGEQGAWHPNGHEFIAPEINFLDETFADTLEGLQALANSHLILFNLDDKSTQDLSPSEGMEDTAPAYSPDGSYLIFARKFLEFKEWTPGRQIWLARTSLIEAQQLSNDVDYNHFDFAWNPNGDQLAYVRFHQTSPIDPPEIWLMDPFTARTVLLITGGYAPQWIP